MLHDHIQESGAWADGDDEAWARYAAAVYAAAVARRELDVPLKAGAATLSP